MSCTIREFGFRQSIVVDDEGVIIAERTRYLAAHKLSLEKVPVHVAERLTPAQIRAYRLADNKTAELAVRAIQYSFRSGENVLDLFGGSGSTMIACEHTSRKAFLMELDPPCCDVIVVAL